MPAPNYAAPALDKGLEILELLAGRSTPVSQAEIASELGRSKAELYRMLLTLEHLNFIRRDETGNGYEMTSRLFELGRRNPVRQRLLSLASPHMQALARDTGQSCHLSVVLNDAIVVVSRVESDAMAGFSVKVGFRVSAVNGSSGRVFYAFQSRAQQAAWLGWVRNRAGRADLKAFLTDADTARRQGYLVRDSYYTQGVTDLIAPVLQQGQAVAALVVPFMDHLQSDHSQTEVLEQLISAARALSEELG